MDTHSDSGGWRAKWEECKKRYPPELNIEGLEPALSSDITEIVAIAKQEGVRETQERLHGEIEGKRVIGMTAEECKCCTARNQALDDLLSKLN